MNLPVLYDNCLSMLKSEYAKSYWLWLAENHDTSRMKHMCDRLALEVDDTCSLLECGILDKAFSLCEDQGIHIPNKKETKEDLIRFFLKRHANYRLGGNVKMWWEVNP